MERLMIVSCSMMDCDWELTSPSNGVRTLVLVGRTGNGKSATANSILGKKAFKSKASSSGVTDTCELQSTVLRDGQMINVIDTPGLFDISVGSEFICREIAKCINMSKDGIHAVLVVLSVRNRFSAEEEAALLGLQKIFGARIVDYMIVVFTGGDELEDSVETLEDYLGRECPAPLKDILDLCKNRRVLFDNKTKDESKKVEQVERLLSLVNRAIAQNDGQPYTDELFAELKSGEFELGNEGLSERQIAEFKDQMERSYEARLEVQLKRISEMIESKLRETTARLEQELAEEKAARARAEEQSDFNQKKSDDEIRKLREDLEKAREETGSGNGNHSCAIL